MADLGSIGALKTSIISKVYTNVTFDVSAQDIQDSFIDLIDTLKLSSVDTTYSGLVTSISNSELVPGVLYKFEYENVHQIFGEAITNTETPGYSPKVETFVALAISENKISPFVYSVENPYDIIEYSPVGANIGSTPVANNGSVLRRKDSLNDIDTPFDFRNHLVARYSPDESSYRQVGTPSGDRGDLVETTFDNSGDVRFILLNGTVNGAPGDCTPVVVSFSYLENLIPVVSPLAPNLDPLEKKNKQYIPSIQGSSEVFISNQCLDILVKDSNKVSIGKGTVMMSISSSSIVTVGESNLSSVVSECNGLSIGNSCSSMIYFYCVGATINGGGMSSVMSYLENSKVGASISQSIIFDLSGSDLGVNIENSIIFASKSAKVGNSCSGLTISSGKGTDIGDYCIDLTSLGGNYNTFERGCSNIDVSFIDGNGALFGYTTYTPMQYTTFRRGCTNIVFEKSGFAPSIVNNCEFGEGCSNLIFDTNLETVVFHRATENKDFRGKALSSVNFLNSSSTPWVHNNAVDGQTVLGTGFNVSGNPQPVISPQKEPVSDPAVETRASTYEKCVYWDWTGRPRVMFM